MSHLATLDRIIETRRRVEAETDPIGVGSWPVLARRRWGLSIGSIVPGIVIDRPDPARRRLALESLGTGPGDAHEQPNIPQEFSWPA